MGSRSSSGQAWSHGRKNFRSFHYQIIASDDYTTGWSEIVLVRTANFTFSNMNSATDSTPLAQFLIVHWMLQG